ncbi:MAG: hypothetical protein WCE91_07505 [Nitrososphaeraceae archaeon]
MPRIKYTIGEMGGVRQAYSLIIFVFRVLLCEDLKTRQLIPELMITSPIYSCYGKKRANKTDS